MDQLLFHPKVVHLPMALAVLMPLIAGGALFAWWRGWLDRRAWVGVVLLQAVLLGSGVVAMNTGEQEEDHVEEVVAEQHVEAHEEAAEFFVWASAAVLVLMALPLALPEGRTRRAAALGACLGTLIVSGFGYNVGQAGGKLVYQYGAAQAYVSNGGAADVVPVGDKPEEGDSDGH